MRGLNRACMRIRIMVCGAVLSSSSPRSSAGAVDLVDWVWFGLMVIKVSCKVCSWNVPGVLELGSAMTLKHSSGETASEVADRAPILSQARNL